MSLSSILHVYACVWVYNKHSTPFQLKVAVLIAISFHSPFAILSLTLAHWCPSVWLDGGSSSSPRPHRGKFLRDWGTFNHFLVKKLIVFSIFCPLVRVMSYMVTGHIRRRNNLNWRHQNISLQDKNFDRCSAAHLISIVLFLSLNFES